MEKMGFETGPKMIRSGVENAINSSLDGEAAGFDNIPAELLKTGDRTIDLLHRTCNKIWHTGVWPSQ